VGFYAQDQIRLDRFLLTMSGRQDLVNTSTFDRLFTGTATDQEDRAFSGRVGLLYESEIGVSPYASYSTSFSPLAGTNFYGRGFKPETGEQVEVGAKYQPDWPSTCGATTSRWRTPATS
jgi:iron complex outermembrane receptor protein